MREFKDEMGGFKDEMHAFKDEMSDFKNEMSAFKDRAEQRDIKRFAKAMTTARDFLPEYSDRKFIGAIASLYVDERLVRQGERQGLIVLGFGTNVMQILNTSGFTPKLF